MYITESIEFFKGISSSAEISQKALCPRPIDKLVEGKVTCISRSQGGGGEGHTVFYMKQKQN